MKTEEIANFLLHTRSILFPFSSIFQTTTLLDMAATKTQETRPATKTQDKYSILIPTYNEKENLPIITQMIMTALEPEFGV